MHRRTILTILFKGTLLIICQVVPKDSAILYLPNELPVGISADHREICRFSDRHSQKYVQVENAIRDMVTECM